MTTYHEVVVNRKKTRISSETYQDEEWFDLKRVLVAIGYASYTTHQENSLKDSGVRLLFKRKRVYANIQALEYMRDNIAMSNSKKDNLVTLLKDLPKPTANMQNELPTIENDQPLSVFMDTKPAWLEERKLTKIYIAGRMHYGEYEGSQWGEHEGYPPVGRALLGINLSKSDGKTGDRYLKGEPESFWFGTQEYLYTGPFFLGDNHGCLNSSKYHMLDECSYGEISQKTVVEVCKRQIASADIFFAWLSADSNEAYGTLAEIGYAKGLGKPVYVACKPDDGAETWFAKCLADAWFKEKDFISAFRLMLLTHEIHKVSRKVLA